MIDRHKPQYSAASVFKVYDTRECGTVMLEIIEVPAVKLCVVRGVCGWFQVGVGPIVVNWTVGCMSLCWLKVCLK